jgi:hypothetical protein
MDFIPLIQKKLCEEAAVLSCDASDQSAHEHFLSTMSFEGK